MSENHAMPPELSLVFGMGMNIVPSSSSPCHVSQAAGCFTRRAWHRDENREDASRGKNKNGHGSTFLDLGLSKLSGGGPPSRGRCAARRGARHRAARPGERVRDPRPRRQPHRGHHRGPRGPGQRPQQDEVPLESLLAGLESCHRRMVSVQGWRLSVA